MRPVSFRSIARIRPAGEAHGEWGPMPTMFYLYVDGVDAWYRRALAAGATSMEAPALQPYGDRAGVRDAFDNQWYLAEPAAPRRLEKC